ncbi:phosphoribosyltransferase [Microbulbifer sp. SAOS-129_SWC]|uniref:phosphoribosyltransferase n=1 Tax=Microbulbifer sp. SAOS-129_SWC TaxID=3145235 RepID=UPI0032170105
MQPFANRIEAGRALAQSLGDYRDRKDTIVLALPRGGVPVGLEVARALSAPLDLMLVRKLGVPGHEELAMGAITGSARVLNEDVIRSCGISDDDLERETRAERAELQRRAVRYRGERPWPALRDRCVILVDDGIATGATMAAAARAVRAEQPEQLVIAVPVAPPAALARFSGLADRIECPLRPMSFWAIGAWYHDFSQLSDEQVLALMREAQALGGGAADE